MTASSLIDLLPLPTGAVIGVHVSAGQDRDRLVDLAAQARVHTTIKHTVSASFAVVDNTTNPKGAARQAAEEGIDLVDVPTAVVLLEELDGALGPAAGPGYCGSENPRLPVQRPRSWEDHDYGSCGWPEERCGVPVHRQRRCRSCRLPLLVDVCQCDGSDRPTGTGFTRDPRTGWWVHDGCGLSTRAWLDVTSVQPPAVFDGTPAFIARPFARRADVESRWRPLPGACQIRDRQMAGRTVWD